MLKAELARCPSHGRLPALPQENRDCSWSLGLLTLCSTCIMGAVGHAIEYWAGAFLTSLVPAGPS